METVRKIDIHAHAVPDTKLFPKHKATGLPFLSPEQLIARYDELGIEKGVLLGGVSPDACWILLTSENNKLMADQYPDRLDWFCSIDPRMGEHSATADLGWLIEHYKNLGAKGVGEITANLYADDPMMDNLFACCAEYDMPVIIHISPSLGFEYGIADDAGLPRIEKMLKKHKKLRLIGHSQPFWGEISARSPGDDRNCYPKGKVKEGALARLLRDNENLYCDLSAGSGSNAMMRDREYAASFLTEFADRIYYGCDMCAINQMFPFPFRDFLEELRTDGSISETVYRKVCRENALKLLGMEE